MTRLIGVPGAYKNQHTSWGNGGRCPVCKKRIRGKNHEEGDHHKGKVIKVKTKR